MRRIVSALGKVNWGKSAFGVFALCTTTAIALRAQTFNTLHSFDGTDGYGPTARLVQTTTGDLYGTTSAGGANPGLGGGGGTIFKIAPSGTLATLYNFCSRSGCTDGFGPNGKLIEATNGYLYGITMYGGAGDNCSDSLSCGTVFRITPSGTLSTLYSFCSESGCVDGDTICGGLVQDTNGVLYGTTELGGAYVSCYQGCGTVFSLSVGLGRFVETQTISGAVGATVKILGTGLTGTTSVTFNGTAATFTVVSGALITTTVPASASTGIVQVVTSSGTLSSNEPFHVLP